MKKYIDPEKIDFRVPYGMDASGEVLLPLSAVRSAIAQTPGEDVVEVVRCTDCKYWEHLEDVDFVCKLNYGYRLSTDFCSYGKRKEQA